MHEQDVSHRHYLSFTLSYSAPNIIFRHAFQNITLDASKFCGREFLEAWLVSDFHPTGGQIKRSKQSRYAAGPVKYFIESSYLGDETCASTSDYKIMTKLDVGKLGYQLARLTT
jgi:hypothetical protein